MQESSISGLCPCNTRTCHNFAPVRCHVPVSFFYLTALIGLQSRRVYNIHRQSTPRPTVFYFVRLRWRHRHVTYHSRPRHSHLHLHSHAVIKCCVNSVVLLQSQVLIAANHSDHPMGLMSLSTPLSVATSALRYTVDINNAPVLKLSTM